MIADTCPRVVRGRWGVFPKRFLIIFLAIKIHNYLKTPTCNLMNQCKIFYRLSEFARVATPGPMILVIGPYSPRFLIESIRIVSAK